MWILWAILTDNCSTRMDGLVTKAVAFMSLTYLNIYIWYSLIFSCLSRVSHLRIEELVPTSALHINCEWSSLAQFNICFFRVKLLSTHIMPDILVSMKNILILRRTIRYRSWHLSKWSLIDASRKILSHIGHDLPGYKQWFEENCNLEKLFTCTWRRRWGTWRWEEISQGHPGGQPKKQITLGNIVKKRLTSPNTASGIRSRGERR